MRPGHLLISPGPGHPAVPGDVGLSAEVLEGLPEVPTLGVCLGHQLMALLAGWPVVHAPEPVHGHPWPVHHRGAGLFAGLASPMIATRYHSLIAARPMPGAPDGGFEVDAWTEEGLVMAIRHRRLPRYGVQFHPESVSTPEGHRLINAFFECHPIRSGATLQARTTVQARTTAQARTEVQARPVESAAPCAPLPWRDPEAAFMALIGAAPGVWLDDGRQGQGFSVIAPAARLHRLTGIGELRALLAGSPGLPARPEGGRLPFGPGLYGWIDYEGDGGGWLEAREALVWDHAARQVWLTGAGAWGAAARAVWEGLPAEPPPPPEPMPGLELVLDRTAAAYRASIRRLLADIRDGETYEACLSLEAVGPPLDPLRYHRCLRRRTPAAFGALIRLPERAVVSASPELYLRLSPDGRMETEPIKGTRRRSADPVEDQRLRQELRDSPKEQAELRMITDLWRNDLASVAAPGSVNVPEERRITAHPHLYHASSTVTARLRDGLDVVDALLATFPGGTITGAPKRRTRQLLQREERRRRGPYTGVIGFIGGGSAALSVAIRTADCRADQTRIGSGGAIVAASRPEEEWEEVLLKMSSMMAPGMRIAEPQAAELQAAESRATTPPSSR